jgi:hypothetical protein
MWVTLLALFVVLVAGLERNHRRRPDPRYPPVGRTGVQDRDLERILAELRSVADCESRRATEVRGIDPGW